MRRIDSIRRWAAAGALAATVVASSALPDDARRAPPLTGDGWINSKPLAPADLRGRVLLVEFWTFDCINCRRTVPAMRKLSERFPAGGDVVIVGVHTPELEHERDPANVRRAVSRLGVRYPVVLDGRMAIWRAFGNSYWPALYLIDRRGLIRDTHIGELHEGSPEWDALLAKIETLRAERAPSGP